MLDKKQVREIAGRYAERVKQALNPEAIILFGSYVSGNAHEWSDIDIAVLVRNVDDDKWYDTSVLLYDISGDISFDIEPHLLDADYDPSGFVSHVKNTGEVIYCSAV